ncbi:hypothetical protein N7481_003836 [Penicillium waksmanii]|uniref:uncharacterized protein n=1 Tax=Penicillium waksmanii TaxID=69791 RepID=UPI0025486E08|nr:uncharacterized protein N7481_003836 [Penicillium waksmanii]KAJ5988626.1 hypothetical protein N7481_003836 [Penicillium waksmanii]
MRLALNLSVFFLVSGIVAASEKNHCHNTADPHEGLPKNICMCPDGRCYNDIDGGVCEDLSEETVCIT